MRHLLYGIFFILLCIFSCVLSQPALAASRGVSSDVIFAQQGTLQESITAYSGTCYSTSSFDLSMYPARRIRPVASSSKASAPHSSSSNADSYFYDGAAKSGKEGAE